jgi:hypothetical protein
MNNERFPSTIKFFSSINIYPCNIFLSYNQLIIDFTMCLHLQSQISVYLHVANFKLLIMIKIVTKNTKHHGNRGELEEI